MDDKQDKGEELRTCLVFCIYPITTHDVDCYFNLCFDYYYYKPFYLAAVNSEAYPFNCQVVDHK